jgi:septal ring factor EnvC (AmiA/AmiB activator)
VTPEDHTDAERERSEARGAELRSELAATNARRAEEETAEAEKDLEKATERKEERERKEKELREKAAQAERIAQREREEAEAAEAAAPARPGVAAFAAGGVEAGSERPEILVGAAFAGAFLFARIMKRLVD